MKKLSSMVSSPPDRENVVFEIWFGKRQVAEISHEPGCSIEIEIYPAPENKNWKFELEDFKAVLEKATINLKP